MIIQMARLLAPQMALASSSSSDLRGGRRASRGCVGSNLKPADCLGENGLGCLWDIQDSRLSRSVEDGRTGSPMSLIRVGQARGFYYMFRNLCRGKKTGSQVGSVCFCKVRPPAYAPCEEEPLVNDRNMPA